MTIVLVGGGGHAKVVLEIFRSSNVDVAGVVDRNPDVGLDLPYLGDDGSWDDLISQGLRRAHVAVGDNRIRARLAAGLLAKGVELVSAIHPKCYLSRSASVGPGVALMPGAIVQPGCDIGGCCIVNTGASVDHDVRLGWSVHVGPGATLAGSVRVGDLSFIGAGTTVIPGVSIGQGSIIGAGSCVVRPIPDNVVAYGVPARVQRGA